MTDTNKNNPQAIRRNAHGQVVHDLGERIVRGDLPPGHGLPNETDLGVELGVSRTIIREAIKTLSAKGMIISRPKTGTRVRDRKHWNMLDPELLGWISTVGDVGELAQSLFEIRLIIEPAAAAIAAKTASDEAIAKIQAAYDDMEAAGENVEAVVEPDLRFHQAILEATDNVFLAPLGAIIESALAASFQMSSSHPGAFRNALPLHKAVLESIKNGDAETARKQLLQLLGDAASDYANAASGQNLNERGI